VIEGFLFIRVGPIENNLHVAYCIKATKIYYWKIQ